MRWRFVDKIETLQPWQAATGRKAISYEESSLCEPLGRRGILPESLVLESCVHLVRWLVAASSQFASTCLLGEVERFALLREVGIGDSLALATTVLAREPDRLRVECRAESGGQAVAEGVLSVALLPLAACAPPEDTRSLWRELSAPHQPSGVGTR
ncbi:MAG TPA: hypothetical protein VNE39_18770 [Planctomycetota bacterium]|nr:hypothetical protein [Planctomycetota bacterium]